MSGGGFFFSSEISEKCLNFTTFSKLRADDTWNYGDNMPGDLSASYKAWIWYKKQKKKWGEKKAEKNVSMGATVTKHFFCFCLKQMYVYPCIWSQCFACFCEARIPHLGATQDRCKKVIQLCNHKQAYPLTLVLNKPLRTYNY